MQSNTHSAPSLEVLSRSIDRFLRADGWLVTEVTMLADNTGYDVTLTKGTEPHMGHRVTRHASSAGEATLKACSSARRVGEPDTSPA